MAITGGPAATRRTLLRAAAAAGAATAVPRPAPAQDAPPGFKNDREMVLLAAITAHFIPADEHTPSAADMDVLVRPRRPLHRAC